MNENQQRIRELVEQGVAAARIHEMLGLSSRTVYTFLRKHNLPRNYMPKPGGRRETMILRAIGLGYSIEEVGQLYSLVPHLVEKVIADAREREVG